MKELMLLDSDSNVTIMCNKKYARNTRDTSDSLHIETNGGSTIVKQKCYIHDIGKHLFSAKSMTNILSLSDIADKHKVTLDTSEEKSFRVHYPRKIVKFKQFSDRLHGLIPSDNSFHEECPINSEKGLQFVSNTVKENLEYFSEAMKKRASKARKACIASSGTPKFTSPSPHHSMTF